MDENFYFYKNMADRLEWEMQEKGRTEEEWSMMLFNAVANMAQISIELMRASQGKKRMVSLREIVREQAKQCDFIDLNVWNQFFEIRNQLAHRQSNDIPTDTLVRIIIPEIVKEYELLKDRE